jgi:hypothetical protein
VFAHARPAREGPRPQRCRRPSATLTSEGWSLRRLVVGAPVFVSIQTSKSVRRKRNRPPPSNASSSTFCAIVQTVLFAIFSSCATSGKVRISPDIGGAKLRQRLAKSATVHQRTPGVGVPSRSDRSAASAIGCGFRFQDEEDDERLKGRPGQTCVAASLANKSTVDCSRLANRTSGSEPIFRARSALLPRVSGWLAPTTPRQLSLPPSQRRLRYAVLVRERPGRLTARLPYAHQLSPLSCAQSPTRELASSHSLVEGRAFVHRIRTSA